MVVAINYGTHVGSSYAFNEFCVPKSVWDIPASIVATASPVCSFLLTVMQTTQNNYAVGITTTIAALVASVLK